MTYPVQKQLEVEKCPTCGRNQLIPATRRGGGVEGIVDYDAAAALALEAAANIITRSAPSQFTGEIVYFRALADKLRGERK